MNDDASISYRVRFDEWVGSKRVQRSRTFRVVGVGERAETTARRQAEKFALSLEQGTTEPDAGAMTVEELVEKWIEAKRPRVEASTLLRYQQVSRDHVTPTLGGLKLRTVTPLAIERWLTHQRDSDASTATVRGRWGILGGIFGQAVKWRLIPHNPCDGVDAPPTGKPRDRVLSEGEVRALLTAATGAVDVALFNLLAATGCRIGEAVPLRWTDLDLDGGTVRFHQTLTRTEAGVIVREGTKSHEDRTVTLDGPTVAALRSLRRERIRLLDRLGLPFDAAGFCFATRISGRVPSEDGASKRLRRTGMAAGIPDLNPHLLRHTHITVLLRAGVSPAVVAARVGHKTMAMTQAYNHPDVADQRRASEAFRRAIEGERTG